MNYKNKNNIKTIKSDSNKKNAKIHKKRSGKIKKTHHERMLRARLVHSHINGFFSKF